MILKKFRTSKVKEYFDYCIILLKSKKIKPIISENLRLELYVFPPDNRRRDLDNLCKSVLDILQHAGVYKDDRYINELYIKRQEIKLDGDIFFILKEI